MKRKIRMGMVGGGQGSFIGAVHRIAANLDGQIELVWMLQFSPGEFIGYRTIFIFTG